MSAWPVGGALDAARPLAARDAAGAQAKAARLVQRDGEPIRMMRVLPNWEEPAKKTKPNLPAIVFCRKKPIVTIDKLEFLFDVKALLECSQDQAVQTIRA